MRLREVWCRALGDPSAHLETREPMIGLWFVAIWLVAFGMLVHRRYGY